MASQILILELCGITEQIINGMCTDKTEIIDFGGKGSRVNYSAQL